MLLTHINSLENYLVASSQIQVAAGHTVHRGTPREVFIKNFLQNHLSETISFGTGEIVDANSAPRQQRNQIDIVLYKKNYPKLDFGGGISGFLAESVVATIEVKSLLTEIELFSAFDSIRNTKALQRNIITSFTTGYQPPSILSFIVAYAGPANMSTIHGWINKYIQQRGIQYPPLPATGQARAKIAAPLSDLIVVLEKGYIQYDNSPVSYVTDQLRQTMPNGKWCIVDAISGNLFTLFLQLTVATSGTSANWLDLNPYLRNVSPPNGVFRE